LYHFQTGDQGCETTKCFNVSNHILAVAVNNYANNVLTLRTGALVGGYGLSGGPQFYSVPSCKLTLLYTLTIGNSFCCEKQGAVIQW